MDRARLPIGPRLLELIERLGSLLRADRQHLPTNLRPVHLRALDYVSRCNRYSNTPAALASYLGATRGTTSQSIAVLERRKLLRRTRDPDDRRIVRLHLTGRGKQLLRQERDTLIRKLESWETVAPADLAKALEVLERLLRHLQRENDYRTFGLCRTCRHLLREGPGKFRCGLTLEPLAPAETEQICHEHEYPAP
jgi:DNA-binding MarR family transcriptional regulator